MGITLISAASPENGICRTLNAQKGFYNKNGQFEYTVHVLRAKNPAHREIIYKGAVIGYQKSGLIYESNNHVRKNEVIWYDNGLRGTLQDALIQNGGVTLESLRTLTKKCYCDCSSFASVLARIATGSTKIGLLDTLTLHKLVDTGLFDDVINNVDLETGRGLLQGDILVQLTNRTSKPGHATIVAALSDDITLFQDRNIPGIVPDMVLSVPQDEESSQLSIYGQSSTNAVEKSSPLRIAVRNDNVSQKYSNIVQVYMCDSNGNVHQLKSLQCGIDTMFIGDSRVSQLGTSVKDAPQSETPCIHKLVRDRYVYSAWNAFLFQTYNGLPQELINSKLNDCIQQAKRFKTSVKAFNLFVGVNDVLWEEYWLKQHNLHV